jgi:hypothetical protein
MSGESQSCGLVESLVPCSVCRTEHHVVLYRGASICAACLGNRGIMPTDYAREARAVHERHKGCCGASTRQEQSDRDRVIAIKADIAGRKASASSKTKQRQIDGARLMKRRIATSG